MSWYLDSETGDVLPTSEDFGDVPDDVRKLYENDPNRFVAIDPMDSSDGYRIMEAFVSQLPEDEARRALSRTLTGRKPFESFKHALDEFPDDRAAWFEFHNERMLDQARDFLSYNEIEFEEA